MNKLAEGKIHVKTKERKKRGDKRIQNIEVIPDLHELGNMLHNAEQDGASNPTCEAKTEQIYRLQIFSLGKEGHT